MPKPKTDVLATKPQQLRGTIARGLAAAPAKAVTKPVDREGGEYGAGLIRGYAAITRGEALGHGVWVDGEMLQQVADSMNAAGGVKARFTHPGMSSDGLGKKLGKTKDAYVDGDIVRADLHFTKASHTTPDGDLAEYVMDMAEETPELFGTSIVYSFDEEAERAHAIGHGAVEVEDPFYGGTRLDFTNYQSPDPLNVDNLPHSRLAKLWAVDAVDDPAANAGGLFSRGQQIPAEAFALFDFALGLSDEPPASAVLGVHPDRLRGFASRYLSNRGLSVVKGTPAMSKNLSAAVVEEPVTEPVAEEVVETPAVEPVAEAPEAPTEPVVAEESPEAAPEAETQTEVTEEAPVAEPVAEAPAAPAEQLSAAPSGRELCRSYIEKFGAADGASYFADGLDLAACYEKHTAKLTAEVESLNARLTAALAAAGEESPVSFSPDGGKKSAPVVPGLTPGQAAYAAGITIPGR